MNSKKLHQQYVMVCSWKIWQTTKPGLLLGFESELWKLRTKDWKVSKWESSGKLLDGETTWNIHQFGVANTVEDAEKCRRQWDDCTQRMPMKGLGEGDMLTDLVEGG